LDIREILRRLQLGERDRRIARDLHLSRKTVGKYREWAAAQVRVETPPGDEAQVDFGYAGLMHDPRSGSRRKAWAFVMTLSFQLRRVRVRPGRGDVAPLPSPGVRVVRRHPAPPRGR
jgi:hypothetical protein